jgi:GST-like protein
MAITRCGRRQGDQKAADYLKINPTARIPTLIDPEGPGGKPLTVTQSLAILMYLCEKTGKFLPADPVARVRMFQWMAEGAADYAPTNQNIFFLGARMPERCRIRLSSSSRTASSICGALPTSSSPDAISSRRRNVEVPGNPHPWYKRRGQ